MIWKLEVGSSLPWVGCGQAGSRLHLPMASHFLLSDDTMLIMGMGTWGGLRGGLAWMLSWD
jgi:hypothetical protein